jgi:hypothetical protein
VPRYDGTWCRKDFDRPSRRRVGRLGVLPSTDKADDGVDEGRVDAGDERLDEVLADDKTSGVDIDKFDHFGLTTDASEAVEAPQIRECYANFECRLADDRLVDRYNFFIWEVVRARAATSPEYPQTLHYTGDGVFMVAGEVISRRDQFLPRML